jgi:hypothetical protein
VQRFDTVSGTQTTVSFAGWFHFPRDILVEADGSLIVVEPGVGPILPALVRVDPVMGLQVGISWGGMLSDPRGVGLEADGSLVVAGSSSVLRVDPVSGAQSLVASGGNLAALGGIAVDDCTGDLFAAERGVSSAPAALVRIHPSTGAQSLVSSGGLLVEPYDVSFVPGACAALPLVGAAFGGSIGVEIGDVTVSVPTLAGQPLAMILTDLALAIRNHPALESQGIAATVSGLVLQVRGGAPWVRAFSGDPGLLLRTQVPASVPALRAPALAALAALLAGAGVVARRPGGRSR